MAILGQRCPRCREGRLFKSALRMNDPCTVCGQVFEREPGYFLGAMYFSYGMATLYFVPVFFALRWLLPDWPALLIPLLAGLLFLPLMPSVYRMSRTLWIHFDRATTPSEISSNQAWMKYQEASRQIVPEQTPQKLSNT